MSVLSTENFSETGPRSLDLFSVPPTQTAIEKIIFEEVRPISQITGNAPIEFIISGQNGMQYVDLKHSKLQVKAKIRKSDGTNLGATEYVGPVNLFMSSLFSQVDLTLQSKTVTSTTNHYPYKAIIQSLLCYGSGAKKSQLSGQIWANDPEGTLNVNDVKTGANTGLFERSEYFAESKLVDMEGQIFHDLFNLDRYILNQVAIGVKMYRSKPEFCLITNEKATGKWLHNSDNGLTRKSISGGYALYCYTIEPNFGDDGNYLTLLKQGNVRLEATFGTALPASTSCIVYAEYPGYFEISASRDIILE
ncbi:hypothetical protein KUTeg_014488 [Tegillarca granosa]|uniref:Uncharacterized protein n=1 Tax=Tegillarca granosa TaxID=220873 RepID=A0ABQ9ERV7_TEGGR|nr:hypothetical protein KUTeg_014488 [Tegillarca granosa]